MNMENELIKSYSDSICKMIGELGKSSVRLLLQDSGEQKAMGRIRSIHFEEEMSLVGFVPFSIIPAYYKFTMGINLNDHLLVTPYIVKFSKDMPAFPVFKTVSKATGEKIVVDDNLVMDSIIDVIPKEYLTKNSQYLQGPLMGANIIKLLHSNIFDCKGLFEKNEKGQIEYIVRSSDFLFSDGIGNFKGISNDFLCLCSYLKKDTGEPNYIVLPSLETIRVLPSDKQVIVGNPFI